MKDLIVYYKDDCAACNAVFVRLREFGVNFKVVKHSGAVPILKVGGAILNAPISTKKLKKFLNDQLHINLL